MGIFKSTSKWFIFLYLILTALFLGVLAIPSSASVTFVSFYTLLPGLFGLALYGIIFSIANEAKIPVALMGTAVGVASLIGYSPDLVHYTQEVLFIRKGRLRVDFYDEKREYLESRELGSGDVILLIAGGHGFEVLEEVEMIEVKQGPYVGEGDKTRFSGISSEQVVYSRAGEGNNEGSRQ